MKNKINFLLLLFMINTALASAYAGTSFDCSSYFSCEPVQGANGLIKFNNLSSGEFNTWTWDFGDGFNSEVYNPEHQYIEFGTYIVCLTISDGLNCNDTYCDTIVVMPDCDADFEFSYVPTTPINIQFTDLSTGMPDSWLWDFGDGGTSTMQNPVHAYENPGTYEVCLIIENSDSLHYCLDSICKMVEIPDSLNCEAIYTYEINEDDPLQVYFFDHSVGNITNWEWDFGDGAISNELNPVHNYNQAGEYLVCLKVENSDTSAQCLHFICETIILNDSMICHSEFLAVVDSNSNAMYRYSFIDLTTGNPDGWVWDFGDGNYSQEQHPEHTYEEAGTYQVCLTSWNSNYPGCTDSHCILVKTENYFNLGGLAFIGDNPLNNPEPTGDTGLAILYRQNGNGKYIAVDTNLFHELGYYWFNDMMEMDYLVRISLSPGSVHYNDFTPSYYPGSLTWYDADVFALSDNLFEMNTSMMSAPGTEIGPGRISGRVISGDKRGVEANRSFYDVPVILTNQSFIPVKWTLTNEYGQFNFNNLPYGTYRLYADVTGIWPDADVIVLDESYPAADTTWIKMYHGSPFGVEEQNMGDIRINTLYPNPVTFNANLRLEAERNLLVQIDIINLTGQIIFSNGYQAEKGTNNIRIPLGDIPDGLYLVSIKHEGQKQVLIKKFIKN